MGLPIAGILAACAGRPRRVYLEDASFGDIDIAPGSAQVTAQVTAGGGVNEVDSGGTTAKFTWLLSGAASAYEIHVHQDSGTAVIGDALDTWLALSSTRSWILSQAGLGSSVASLTVQIRSAANEAVLNSAVFSMSAVVSAP